MRKTNLKKPMVNNLIDKTTRFEDLVEKIFKIYLEEILNNHELLSNSYDVEKLHQIRISLRKFKSFLCFIKNDIPRKEWKYANTLYKKLIKPTSRARDFDVFKCEYLRPSYFHNENMSEFQEICAVFENKQNVLHEYIENHITSQQYLNNLKELQTWITKLQWRNESSKHNKLRGKKLIKLINKMVQHRYKNIIKTKEHVLNFNQKELHQYRIDIKELRYTLETLGPYIEHGKKETKFLKNMQETLGKINDTYTAENVVQKLNTNNNHAPSRSYLEQRAFDQRHRYLIQLDNIK